nr:hypothetical protein [Microctonus hyperodae filamentous virus]
MVTRQQEKVVNSLYCIETMPPLTLSPQKQQQSTSTSLSTTTVADSIKEKKEYFVICM